MRRAVRFFAIFAVLTGTVPAASEAWAMARLPGNDQAISTPQAGSAQNGNEPAGVPEGRANGADVTKANGDAAEFVERVCTVSSIHDGDSMRVRCPGYRSTLRVRLHQIDAPELDQAHGTRSREFLRSICPINETVVVRDYGADNYNRRLGRLYCNGIDVNAAMIESGAAWVYEYHATDKQLFIMQDQARALKRGLWATSSDKEPLPPWDFRYQQRKQERNQNR